MYSFQRLPGSRDSSYPTSVLTLCVGGCVEPLDGLGVARQLDFGSIRVVERYGLRHLSARMQGQDRGALIHLEREQTSR
jgi:hypothetical protein